MNKAPLKIPQNKKVILFDGVCNFCNYWVNFVIKRDKNDLFRFASLQSEYAQDILKNIKLSTEDFDTFVLIDSDKFYKKSTAALMVLKHISGWLKIIYPLIILPKGIRDLIYSVIAKYRYKIFGRSELCRIPSEFEKSKFLD